MCAAILFIPSISGGRSYILPNSLTIMEKDFKMCPKCLNGAVRPTGEIVKLSKIDSDENIVGNVSECDNCHYLILYRRTIK
jgi:hypothetical protein